MHLRSFWRFLEMWNLSLSVNCVISSEIVSGTTDTKLYVPVVTLSTQDNGKLLQQLKYVFNTTINRKKCQSKV